MMKKMILPMLAACMMMVGCDDGAHVRTSYYTVQPNQWNQSVQLFDDNTYVTDYYYSQWQNEDITWDVIEDGVVLVYYIDDNGRDNILPYTEYNRMVDTAGNVTYYQERIEYDIEPGVITFKIKDSDFETAESMSNIGPMNFKVSTISNW